MVQEGHSDLHRPCHRVTVERLYNVVVHPRCDVPVLEPFDGVPAGERRWDRWGRWRVRVDRPSKLLRVEPPAIVRPERAHRGLEPPWARTLPRLHQAQHPLLAPFARGEPRSIRAAQETREPPDSANPPVPRVAAQHLV